MCVCGGGGGGGGRGGCSIGHSTPAFLWKCLKCLTSIALRLECGYFDLFLLPLPRTKEINSKPNTKLNHHVHMLLKPCVWAITSYKHSFTHSLVHSYAKYSCSVGG